MTAPHRAELDRLLEADRRLRSTIGVPASLSPDRARAASLVEIGERLLDGSVPDPTAEAFAKALVAVAEAVATHFPGNMFRDLEYPAARLLAEATGGDPAGRLAVASRQLVAPVAAFGQKTTIRFRYVHDFIYGFDWARWVANEPVTRAPVGPFDAPFLAYQERRGHELADLIAENDAKYPPLPKGVARNPFGFSREPADEERLHRDLAERGLIPVEAWRFDACPTWQPPFAALREERARALGLWLGR